MNLAEKIAALPEWPSVMVDGPDLRAALARLQLAREWIAQTWTHHGNCRAIGSFAEPPPCTCGRDALLAALEVSHG